jgi:hypothetical protein
VECKSPELSQLSGGPWQLHFECPGINRHVSNESMGLSFICPVKLNRDSSALFAPRSRRLDQEATKVRNVGNFGIFSGNLDFQPGLAAGESRIRVKRG